MRTYVAIDASYLAHHARHALHFISFQHDRGALFIEYTRRCLQMCERFSTTRIAWCWDSRKSWRRMLFPDYKRNRKKDPSEMDELLAMFGQMKMARREWLPAIGFQCHLRQSGYEADDHMARIALIKREKDRLFLVTSDKDLYQCLHKGTAMYDPFDNSIYNNTSLQKEYGLTPVQWWHMKAIAGCPSDNVPGIRGVGEPSAIKYLRREPLPKHIQQKIEGADFFEWGCADRETLQLVRLPFRLLPGTKAPEGYEELPPHMPIIKRAQIDTKELMRIAKSLEVDHVLKNDLPRWEVVTRENQ